MADTVVYAAGSRHFAAASDYTGREELHEMSLLSAFTTSPSLVRLLLDAGADAEYVVDGATALAFAAQHNATDSMEMLMSHGASLNAEAGLAFLA